MRRNIHFSENSKINQKGVHGYDPLFKVRYLLGITMKKTRGVWTARKNYTIDGIMINCMGRAVTYVQYIPEKPIKHGIKVFAICCDLYAILLCFKVYVVQEDYSDNTALGICYELAKGSGITVGEFIDGNKDQKKTYVEALTTGMT